MLLCEPQKPSGLQLGRSDTAHQLSKHLVEDVHTYSQLGYGGTGDGEVGFLFGQSKASP